TLPAALPYGSMSWSDQIPKLTSTTFRRWAILASLFALSAASLAFEVALTRLFSFLFVKSYVYILISLSVAGIGFGAVLTYYIPPKKRSVLTGGALALPPAMLLLLLVVNSIHTVLIPSLIFTFLVFLSVGIFQVLIFQESGVKVSLLYASDLIGASLGSLLSFLLLNATGAVTTLSLVVLFIALSGLLIYIMYYHKRVSSSAFLFSILALTSCSLFLSFEGRLLPTRTWQKEMTVMLNNGSSPAEIVETRWSAFGRVDLVETGNPLFKTMFIDGAAGTKMVEMKGGKVRSALAQNLLLQYMGGIPLLVTEEDQKQRAAVIGSGGGIDVVTLLLSGYKQIDAVEINPDFIDMVRSYDEFSGGIYSKHPRITIFEDEGRSFLRSSETTYNVILMGLPIIKSARNFSNHSLTENYLFTHNAFSEYRRSLATGGQLIIITHYPNELLRLISNAVTSFQAQGLSSREAMQRVVVIGSDRNPTLVIKNEAFTEAEIAGFKAILENFPVGGSTNFIPTVPQSLTAIDTENGGTGQQRPVFHPDLYALSQGEISLKQYIGRSKEDISAVNDNSPFFYRMERGVPAELLIVGLTVALILLITGVVFSYWNRRLNKSSERWPALRLLISFGMIGFGYMLVEIGVLQKFIVFWHHQTLALTVVLAVILVSSGVGSLISAHIKSAKVLALVAGVISLLAITSSVVLGPLLIQLEGSSGPLKLLITLLLTAPLFLPMGMPFPYLLRSTTKLSSGKTLYPWMIGFNSITTLGGGVLSMIIAMSVGYISVLLAGAVCYIFLVLISLHSTSLTHKRYLLNGSTK
ncbi:MAG: hypothetical protein K9L66_05235, partial [Spirochaetaceae bacterium]|nr:hypothetical protein [Spirochaetaceae bacterium]MCF7951057.1 hypothetical protein [Spirochaetaceae bacterium]